MRLLLVPAAIATAFALSAADRGAATSAPAGPPRTNDPAVNAAALLDADRQLGQRRVGETHTPMQALGAALAADAVMPAPGVGFLEGRDAILAALARDALNATSAIEWHPLRAGIAADGMHGATIGLMAVTRASGQVLTYKYLAYWVHGAEGWRMRVFRRVSRAAGSVDESPVAAWLPVPDVAAAPLAEAEYRQRQQALQGIEQAFSDSAARVGIGPAFRAFGAADAWHLGTPTAAEFTRGVAAIAESVQGNAPVGTSPVTWSAERAILAPSGDFGVTLGYIVPVAAGPDGQRPRFPFFTIWHREAGGWKYIAE